jgi:hypothetical protein
MKFFRSACATEIEKPSQPRTQRSRFVLLGSMTLWLLIVGIGLSVLWNYENTPGASASPPALWPADSKIQRAPAHATLVILVHPHCPCTRATLGELAEIMAHCQGRLTAYVLFLKPAGFADDWEKTDLWQSAAGIPGVKLMVDVDGAEASRFHSQTSGQTILYDVDGRLMFTGGITASRGHLGDNDGQNAIVSLVNTGLAGRTETSVFGCPLFDDNSECRKTKDKNNEY